MTRSRNLACALAGAVLLTACSDDSSPAAQPLAPSFSPAPAPSSAPPAPAGAPDLSATPETVATDIDVPWGLAFLPDGSALIAQREKATIMQVKPGSPAREAYRVPGVDAAGEGGLLGLALAGDWVYAYITADDDNRIIRFKLGSDAKPEVIFSGLAKAGNHNGGRIAFGPDGMLYVGTGDAAEPPRSQDAGSNNGKILRLTPEGKPAPGNPEAGSPIWTSGHRNVQGLAWTADGTMYATEFGQNRLDEVNKIEKGENYGWPEVEGDEDGDSRFTEPLVTWATSDASPSGAAIAGDTLYVAALRGQRLWTVPLGGGEPRAYFTGKWGRLRTVAVAPDGALWLTTSNTDRDENVRDGDDRILRFPAGTS
ncbi:PQQ-dependent sugar dehydrogenase [Actinoplanes sp. NBRC 103695]|uniref:PQQ-dependent sugar dehydrogenase n=1 Tax=Actinoplanes sp. NBRC 103695 TaxID=3032202 RepID=UPI0024A5BCA6|nr:PQQ-dependent sugar dehydrogenase [Actinoplanes sp. NBRC 103695]GLY95885.1 oxidoreductase [Actinoplanes sp. NBRC 103695]